MTSEISTSAVALRSDRCAGTQFAALRRSFSRVTFDLETSNGMVTLKRVPLIAVGYVMYPEPNPVGKCSQAAKL